MACSDRKTTDIDDGPPTLAIHASRDSNGIAVQGALQPRRKGTLVPFVFCDRGFVFVINFAAAGVARDRGADRRAFALPDIAIDPSIADGAPPRSRFGTDIR